MNTKRKVLITGDVADDASARLRRLEEECEMILFEREGSTFLKQIVLAVLCQERDREKIGDDDTDARGVSPAA